MHSLPCGHMFAVISRLFCKFGELFLGAVLSYFTALLLDKFFFSNWREVAKASQVVTIYRPGPGLDILCYYLISGVAAALLLRLLQQWDKKKPRLVLKVVRVMGLSVLVAVLLLVLSKLVLVGSVDAQMEISGHANDPDQFYYLFVRPVMTGQCWLQEPIPLRPGHDGNWWAGAYFGGNRGDHFELIAVASRTRLHPNPFSKPGGYPCNEIPNNASLFVRMVKLE